MKKRSCISIVFIMFVISVFSAAGSDWQWQNPTPQGNILRSVYFVDSNNGWAVGDYGTIVKTTNGGNPWFCQESNTSNHLNCCWFFDKETGWAVGDYGTVLKTTDGGEHWVLSAKLSELKLNKIVFSDIKTGWIAGDSGYIFKTTNSGKTWETLRRIISSHIMGISSVSTGNIAAVSNDFRIIVSSDGGDSWFKGTPSDNDLFCTDIEWIDEQYGIALGRNSIYRTSDSGKAWINIMTAPSAYFIDLCVRNSGFACAVGLLGPIYTTNDSGKSWNEIKYIPLDQYRNYGVYFTDRQTGWVVGEYGKIQHTTDGGITWTNQTVTNSNHINDIYAIDNNYVLCVIRKQKKRKSKYNQYRY